MTFGSLEAFIIEANSFPCSIVTCLSASRSDLVPTGTKVTPSLTFVCTSEMNFCLNYLKDSWSVMS